MDKRLSVDDFRIKIVSNLTTDEIKLNQQEIAAMRKENQGKILKVPETNHEEISTEIYHSNCNISNRVPSEVEERYQYSNYIIDPNKHKFTTMCRILAFIQKFITNLNQSVKTSKSYQTNKGKIVIKTKSDISTDLSKQELEKATKYFFKKGTEEIKHFLKESQYKKISKEKDRILFYTGRILPTQNVSIVGRMTEAIKDLTATTLCVPVLEKHSPAAYSIISEVH